MTRYLLLLVAVVAGSYAVAAWMFGQLTDAGIACAVSAACVLLADFSAFCERRSRARMHAGGDAVWARREAMRIPVEELFAEQERIWGERRPIETFITYDRHGKPVAGFNSQGMGGVWDFENGAPE
jgi:hypothetical protein